MIKHLSFTEKGNKEFEAWIKEHAVESIAGCQSGIEACKLEALDEYERALEAGESLSWELDASESKSGTPWCYAPEDEELTIEWDSGEGDNQ